MSVSPMEVDSVQDLEQQQNLNTFIHTFNTHIRYPSDEEIARIHLSDTPPLYHVAQVFFVTPEGGTDWISSIIEQNILHSEDILIRTRSRHSLFFILPRTSILIMLKET
ncbi:MAG: hypothetical protein Sylvanvirus2_20 [Sylvanvirus sp.]|uniref:Uncharacterized protein n=1 Tax=Sylvanvirus sp. TaxID=2487774 RepID=A0A3G5AIU9_9VIRU|nr:MAG: hypothetical protein Sylvanvirus2_20 [Sylvanvirus sp.]